MSTASEHYRKNMKLLVLAITAAAYGQDALSLRDAVRLAMERNKVIEALVASSDRSGSHYANEKRLITQS